MTVELFQQFPALGEKPLKRLGLSGPAFHRAEASVLMRGLAEVRLIGLRVLKRQNELTAECNDWTLCVTT